MTPGHKFNIKTNLTRTSEVSPKFLPEPKVNNDSRMSKLTVDKNKPSPGEYNTDKAWRSTQLGNREYKLGNDKRVGFTDKIKDAKKFIPGSGHYKYDVGTVFSKISSGPTSIRASRH